MKIKPIACLILAVASHSTFADQVIVDDLVVQGSVCAGFDCANGESFGFDTIRLKENNLRIKFDDTSSSASFPRNDWQLTANDTSNGGQERFSIDDVTNGRTPFTVEANAPSHSLYVDSTGRVGVGTSTPVVNMHIKGGNTPTTRLEQDGSSGFTPQTWDMGGNEANFFVRDVTNGSRLAFKIRPGAPTDSFVIDAGGDVAIGVANAGALLYGTDAATHIRRTDGTASLLIEEASGTTAAREMLELRNAGGAYVTLRNTVTNDDWFLTHQNTNEGSLEFTPRIDGNDAGAAVVFELQTSGNAILSGALTQNSDRNVKKDINVVDTNEILAKVDALEISEWTYKSDDNIRHIGPMAQDFYALFGTGASETGISTIDTAGVALAAIKALRIENTELKARLLAIEAKLLGE